MYASLTMCPEMIACASGGGLIYVGGNLAEPFLTEGHTCIVIWNN